MITAPAVHGLDFHAESATYGVSVRLKGEVSPNASTGQLTRRSTETPKRRSTAIAALQRRGVRSDREPVELCGTATSTVSRFPTAGKRSARSSPFTVGSCPVPQFTAPPLSQSLAVFPKKGGSESNLVFTITRPQGQQYLGQMKTVLPPGVVAKIPSVPLCPKRTRTRAPARPRAGSGRARRSPGPVNRSPSTAKCS